MRFASRLRWPWHSIGSLPPLVSTITFDSSAPVSIFTDETCAMCIVSSRRPIQRGVYCTTLDGVMSTCVGKRWLPLLSRLARNTSPGANGRPFSHTQTAITTMTAPTDPSVHQSQTFSPVTMPDVKLFHTLTKEH